MRTAAKGFTSTGGRNISKSQKHMKCATYTTLKGCSAHFIRTAVLREILLNEINKLLETVRMNEDEFVRSAMENSVSSHNEELKKAKKTLAKSEKRITELDKIISKLYEDNVLGKISDERFATLSKGYESEQEQIKAGDYGTYSVCRGKGTEVCGYLSILGDCS